MIVGPEYVTLKVDPFEGFREQILDMTRPVIESYAAIIQPAVESINRTIAQTAFRDFAPPTITLAPGVVEAMMPKVTIDPSVFDAFKPAIKLNQHMFDMLRPTLDANRAIVDAAQALLRQIQVQVVPSGGVPSSSVTVSSPTAAPPSFSAWFAALPLVEQIFALYAVLIILQLVVHVAHVATDPTANYNPSAAVVNLLQAHLDNLGPAVVGFLVGRRLTK